MFRRSVMRQGDKGMFAAKRRVIMPINPTPSAPASIVRHAWTTDPLKESFKLKFYSSGDIKKEATEVPSRLEGTAMRSELFATGDIEFAALVDFIRGVRHDDMVTGTRFQKVYEKLTENDDVFVWLCMTSMAVLNPGDMRSRLIYRHLEGLAKAVAANEMSQRTAFRFFESAVRSPAYRQIAERQLESGAATRLAGLCAAADVMNRMGLCRRPMQPYFELYQRITERSEALNPWGFPPLFQFEERLSLEKRLKFFSREDRYDLKKKPRATMKAAFARYRGSRIFWVPPCWRDNSKYVGPHFSVAPGYMPD